MNAKVWRQQIPVGVVFVSAPAGETVMRNRQPPDILGEPQLASGEESSATAMVGFYGDGRPIAPEEWPAPDLRSACR